MAWTIFRGYSIIIGFFHSRNPDPKFRAIPWSRGLYLASHLPRTLSIPKLDLILLLNPESRASNKGNHVSRKTYWDPLFSCFLPLHCRLKTDNPTLAQTTTLFGKQIFDEAAVFITCDQAWCFFRGRATGNENEQGKKNPVIAVNCVYFVFPFFSCQASIPILCYSNCFYLKSGAFSCK